MNIQTVKSAPSILKSFLLWLMVIVIWAVTLMLMGFVSGTMWFFLRKGFIAGLSAMLLLFGCSNFIRPTSVNGDEVSLRYDTLANPWPSVVKRAEELCGSPVETVAKWDNIGTRGATFKCTRPIAKPSDKQEMEG